MWSHQQKISSTYIFYLVKGIMQRFWWYNCWNNITYLSCRQVNKCSSYWHFVNVYCSSAHIHPKAAFNIIFQPIIFIDFLFDKFLIAGDDKGPPRISCTSYLSLKQSHYTTTPIIVGSDSRKYSINSLIYLFFNISG